MTNLIGTITLAVATNWTTVAVEQPTCHAANCKEEHHETHYQMGVVTKSTVLKATWKGQERETVLESDPPLYLTRVGYVTKVNTNPVPPLLVKPVPSTNKSTPKK